MTLGRIMRLKSKRSRQRRMLSRFLSRGTPTVEEWAFQATAPVPQSTPILELPNVVRGLPMR
jgi:hypothetical protein